MEIVHVCGHSCVGKRSLIEQLSKKENQKLRERFRINGSTAAYTLDPAAQLPQLNWQPIERLYDSMSEHLLHKWQFHSHKHLLRLRDSRPELNHRAILIWRPASSLRARIVAKGLWFPTVVQLESDWDEKIIPRFRSIAEAGISVEVVDGDSELYSPIEVDGINAGIQA